MAGGSPLPENPLIGIESFVATEGETSALLSHKHSLVTCAEPVSPTPVAETGKTETETGQISLESSIVIPEEERGILELFWQQIDKEEESNKTTATMAGPTEISARVAPPMSEQFEFVLAEQARQAHEQMTNAFELAQASINPPETTPAAEPVVTAEATPAEDSEPSAPLRTEVLFRRICDTCKTHRPHRNACEAEYCQACGDRFAVMWSDEVDNEELRAKIDEVRPDCNPGGYDSAYCKTCLLDWFDNCVAWPHRETLPRSEGQDITYLVKPFVSEAYFQKLVSIQAYWDDKDKVFCPVPTCSTYVPREHYMIVREEEEEEAVKGDEPASGGEETAAEKKDEDKAEEKAEENNNPIVKKMVTKERKCQLAICPSATCRTPICTLCKAGFHGVDTPCAQRLDFFRSFMLSKYLNPNDGKDEDESSETNTDTDEDEDEEYDEEEYPNRFRQCVNCQNLVSRYTGCDHMTCACGYAFCFHCGGEYGDSHDCITDEEYADGEGVGGIKITNEEGFLDEGACVTVNKHDVMKENDLRQKMDELLEVALAYMENDVMRKEYRVKPWVSTPCTSNEMKGFSEDEQKRLGKTMTHWRGHDDGY